MFTKIVLQFVKIHIQCMPTLYLYNSKNELFTIMYLQLRRSWTQSVRCVQLKFLGENENFSFFANLSTGIQLLKTMVKPYDYTMSRDTVVGRQRGTLVLTWGIQHLCLLVNMHQGSSGGQGFHLVLTPPWSDDRCACMYTCIPDHCTVHGLRNAELQLKFK